VVPSNLSSEELDLLRLQFLPRVLKGNHCTAIPFLLQPSLACYSRERLLKAAASLAELLSRAAEGLAAAAEFRPGSTANQRSWPPWSAA